MPSRQRPGCTSGMPEHRRMSKMRLSTRQLFVEGVSVLVAVVPAASPDAEKTARDPEPPPRTTTRPGSTRPLAPSSSTAE